MKIKKFASNVFEFMCPGCKRLHAFSLSIHSWNGDYDKPTLHPSYLNKNTPPEVCHSFINNGVIQFLGDCTHKLAGQTVELPEL